MSTQAKQQKTIHLDGQVVAWLEGKAAVESRSFTGQLEYELRKAMGDVGVDVAPIKARSDKPPSPLSARTKMCEHRVPAGSYCAKGCDDD